MNSGSAETQLEDWKRCNARRNVLLTDFQVSGRGYLTRYPRKKAIRKIGLALRIRQKSSFTVTVAAEIATKNDDQIENKNQHINDSEGFILKGLRGPDHLASRPQPVSPNLCFPSVIERPISSDEKPFLPCEEAPSATEDFPKWTMIWVLLAFTRLLTLNRRKHH